MPTKQETHIQRLTRERNHEKEEKKIGQSKKREIEEKNVYLEEKVAVLEKELAAKNGGSYGGYASQGAHGQVLLPPLPQIPPSTSGFRHSSILNSIEGNVASTFTSSATTSVPSVLTSSKNNFSFHGSVIFFNL
jgi:hypothetical protein